MNQLKLDQLKAAGGVAVELIEHIDYLQKTVDIASRCMGEKQDRIEDLKGQIEDKDSYINQLKGVVDALK